MVVNVEDETVVR